MKQWFLTNWKQILTALASFGLAVAVAKGWLSKEYVAAIVILLTQFGIHISAMKYAPDTDPTSIAADKVGAAIAADIKANNEVQKEATK